MWCEMYAPLVLAVLLFATCPKRFARGQTEAAEEEEPGLWLLAFFLIFSTEKRVFFAGVVRYKKRKTTVV